MTNRLKNNLIGLAVYSLICYIILLPLKMWITGISISILIGVLFGFLNEIITQLRKLNGEKFDDMDNKKKEIERQIKGYIKLRDLAINHGETETVDKFDKLINELKTELNK